VTGSLRLSVRTTASHVVKAGSIPAGITSNLHILFISGALEKCIQQPAAIAAMPGMHTTIFLLVLIPQLSFFLPHPRYTFMQHTAKGAWANHDV
jgi:hypothetical protein